jgi:hypothetical protein
MLRGMRVFSLWLLFVLSWVSSTWARDELVTSAVTPGGETVSYILTTKDGTPAYVVILMPGGKGILYPRMEGGKLAFAFGGNSCALARPASVSWRCLATLARLSGSVSAWS